MHVEDDSVSLQTQPDFHREGGSLDGVDVDGLSNQGSMEDGIFDNLDNNLSAHSFSVGSSSSGQSGFSSKSSFKIVLCPISKEVMTAPV
mgnify:CR=1 FL=1